jgi:hypothetical protein
MANPPHFPTLFEQTFRPHRHRAAEWCPIRRKWIQDGRILRDVKASKAFVWPKDGKNGTKWGRLKDILSNKGPDMFLTMNADKHDYMENTPSRGRWSNHSHLDGFGFGKSYAISSQKYAPWTTTGTLGGRMPGMAYDFRTRKYEVPYRFMWTDARWQPELGKNKHNTYPEAIRNIYGEWFQDSHYLPQRDGGPVHNERGEGRYGRHVNASRWI